MNNWELTHFNMDYDGGLARTFEFELVLVINDDGSRHLMRGDGLLLAGKRVRFNRENELLKAAENVGIDAETVLSYLASHAVEQALQPAVS